LLFAFWFSFLSPTPKHTSLIPWTKQSSNWDSVWTQQIGGDLDCFTGTKVPKQRRRATEGPLWQA
jgi:hypothetical protein